MSFFLRIMKSSGVAYLPLSPEGAAIRGRCEGILRRILCMLSGVLVGLLMVVLVSWILVDPSLSISRWPHPSKRNIIFMVSDGFGPASETFARDYWLYLRQHSLSEDILRPKYRFELDMLPLDSILVGQSRTRSNSSWVTDSAAGATAFSCALKTYNGAIGVNRDQVPCATVLEMAKHEGYQTGLVVTSRITHATPAAFSSHVTFRDYESEIAVQQIGYTPFGRVVDLMFGGGRAFFLPNTTAGSKRKDSRDLETEAKERFGFKHILHSRSDFDSLTSAGSELPILGLFHKDHMSFEIDRDSSVEVGFSVSDYFFILC